MISSLHLVLALAQTPAPVTQTPGIAIERALAEKFDIAVGDTVRLGASPDSLQRLAVVSAIYEPRPDPAEISRQALRVRLHLPDLADVLGAPDRVDRFGIGLAPGVPADSAVAVLNRAAFGFRAHPSAAIASESSQTFKVVSRFHRAIAVITIVASAVFLLCIMLLKVEERRMDAAVMRFVGVRRRTIFGALVLEAALIAVLGSALGAGLAFLAGALTNAYYRRFFDTELIFSLITPRIVLFSVCLSLLLGLAAGAVAAWRLMRTRPMVLWGQGMTGLGWGLKSLRRRPLRTALSLAGIAVASAMLLDMVMLSGGIEQSFSELLLARGYQIRLTPKGTLPFDTEASIRRASTVVREIRAAPGVEAAGAVLGTSIYGRTPDSLVTLFGYGIQPEAQGIYQVAAGADLAPGDTLGVLLSETAAALLSAAPGDNVTLVGRLDPQMAGAAVGRRLAVRGLVRWIYDHRGQPSVGTALPVMQRLGRETAADRASLLLVKAADDAAVEALAVRLRERFPELEVNSVAELVVQAKRRLVYFTQLSYVLGGMSLVVAVLLVGTLLTITVNERLCEIATLRAIGVSRGTIVRQVLAEGVALTVLGAAVGILLGLATAEYLDAILTSFPGLPEAFSFFVPRAGTLSFAALVLLVTGSLAGLYPAWLASRAPIAATLRAEAT